jgi:putative ABC transport system ATP-binding protein
MVSTPDTLDDATAALASPATRHAVFTARGLSKVYRMGEVEVHALRGVDLDIYPSESSCCSGRWGCRA